MQNLNIFPRVQVKSLSKTLQIVQKASISLRTLANPLNKDDEQTKYPRKIFSGIQPTGQLHLGNYLGAVQKWKQLQNNNDDVTYCIVDMHSITIDQNPAVLRENIFEMAATMYACGINPDDSNLFVQSSVKEHSELCWILNCLCTMARLGHLPQFKEKSRKIRDVPLGLYVYPVLQAADIMLYKTTHVPVGEDQVQHIQLAQHLTRTFNSRYGNTFPVCHAILDNEEAARIRSLRNPSKKMSKSDQELKGTIFVRDEPEVIVEKFKKAVTDFTSDVTYDPLKRPGVSNLVAIHSLITRTTINKTIEEARTLDTGSYKLRVADAVVEHFRPIKSKIVEYLSEKSDLIFRLEKGAEKARHKAQDTLDEVMQKMGLGTYSNIPRNIDMNNFAEKPEKAAKTVPETKAPKVEDDGKPVVPKQSIRIESRRSNHTQSLIQSFKTDLADMPKLMKPKDISSVPSVITNADLNSRPQIEQTSVQTLEEPKKTFS